MRSTVLFFAVLFASACLASDVASLKLEGEQDRANKQLPLSAGGMVVQLGYGDGRSTAALAREERHTIQVLESNPAVVDTARRNLQSQNLYGPASVDHFTGSRLPYADNLVNAVITATGSVEVSTEEIMRVLAPGGLLMTRDGGRWTKQVKPWPDHIDDWSHFLHDAGNNAVADDDRIGPPRGVQWVAGPLWLRSHETPSGIQACVSAGGRLFYIFDRGPIGITDERLPERWAIVCRDAFNGCSLWERPISAWGWPQWSRDRYEGKDWTKLYGARMDVPDENQRRLVVTPDRVFVTLSYQGPVSMLDATTGEILAAPEESAGTRELLVSNGTAVCYTHPRASGHDRRRGVKGNSQPALVALDARTGTLRWKKDCGPVRPLQWAIDHDRILALTPAESDDRNLVARSLDDGHELWRAAAGVKWCKTFVAVDDTLVLCNGAELAAHDAATGRLLWKNEGKKPGFMEELDLFVIDGLVWRGLLGKEHVLAIGRDLRTGQEKRRIEVDNLRSPEHHHRCYRNKATSRYIISSFEGAEFVDLLGANHGQNNWVRGACKYGMLPCNGMLYVPPDQCCLSTRIKAARVYGPDAGAQSGIGKVESGTRGAITERAGLQSGTSAFRSPLSAFLRLAHVPPRRGPKRRDCRPCRSEAQARVETNAWRAADRSGRGPGAALCRPEQCPHPARDGHGDRSAALAIYGRRTHRFAADDSRRPRPARIARRLCLLPRCGDRTARVAISCRAG